MSRFAILSTTLWLSAKVRGASDRARSLWLYLLSSAEAMPIPGVVIGGPATHAERLDRTVPWFLEGLAELQRLGFRLRFDLDNRLIWLPNAIATYQRPTSAAQVQAWATFWDAIPDCGLKREIWDALRLACEPFAGKRVNQSKAVLGSFAEIFPEPAARGVLGPPAGPPAGPCSHQEQEQEQHHHHEQVHAAPLGAAALTLTPAAGRTSRKAKATKKPRRVETPIPDGWTPARATTLARLAELALDVAAEVERWRNWTESRGILYVDHEAGFATWVDKAKPRQAIPATSHAQPAFGRANPLPPSAYAAVGDQEI